MEEGSWPVVFTVVAVIVSTSAVAVAIVVLLICVAAKRRLMAVRNNFVPVLSQGVARKQKRIILEEQRAEADFEMAPERGGPEGWVEAELLGDELAAQLAALGAEARTAWEEEEQRTAEPRVRTGRGSRHAGETHAGTLATMSARLIEKHARNVDAGLERDARQDMAGYLKSLQSSLHLDKRVCEKYLALYLRARWTGPVRSTLSVQDLVQLCMYVNTIIGGIDNFK